MEPLGWLSMGSRLPDAIGTRAGARHLEVYELYLRLVPFCVRTWTHAAMPLAKGARRGLHDVENLLRNGRMILDLILVHDIQTLRFPRAPVCALDHGGRCECRQPQASSGRMFGTVQMQYDDPVGCRYGCRYD